MSTEDTTILVKLLDEGTLVYRPVPAEAMSDGTFVVKGPETGPPDDETWEFQPGDIVRVECRPTSDGVRYVAVERIS